MNIVYICKMADEEANIDKIWGIIQIGFDNDTYNKKQPWLEPHSTLIYPEPTNKYVTFWGRRSKKLQTKIWDGYPCDAQGELVKKIQKGYRVASSKKHVNSIYPEFKQDLEKIASWSTLKAL
jgi:hypothetical protein